MIDLGVLREWLAAAFIVDMTRGLLLFAFAYGLTRLFPSLAGRYGRLLWLVVLSGLLLLPCARLVVPPVSIRAVPGPVSQLAAGAVSAAAGMISPAGPERSAGSGASDLAAQVVCCLWLAGVVFFGLRSVVGWIAARGLAAQAQRPRAGFFPVSELADRLRIRRSVELLRSGRCAVPFTFGVLRPRIILPAASRSWNAGSLRAVLTHEMSHIRGLDALWNLCARIICSLLWFLPHAWIASFLMQKEAEKCCDQEVLGLGTRGPDYAATIVDLSRKAGGRILVPATYSFTGRKSMLRERIVGVLSWTGSGASAGLKRAGKAVLLCFVFLLPLLAITCSMRGAEKLYGTWVNTSMSGNYKYTFNPDGTGSYVNRDGTMRTESRFIIEKKWQDEKGGTWYHIKFRWHIPPYTETGAQTFYALARIDPQGSTWEVDGSATDYPAEFFGEAGTAHGLYKRQ